MLSELVGAWRCTRVGRYAVRYDATWRANHSVAGDAEALLIGTAMDLDAPEQTQQDAVDSLAAALSVSDEAFLDRLDALAGAHVVVARQGETHWVLQDATGMEAVAYDIGGEGPLVASHPALIADIRGYELSELARLWNFEDPDPEVQQLKFFAGPWHTPGVTSPYERVRTLTPNTCLELDSGRVERFFPRGPVGTEDMETVVERVAGHLTDAYAWVAREFPGSASVSISGGLDSRLSLASSRAHAPELRYFTYHHPAHPVYRNDLRVAQTLAERLGLDHHAWSLDAGVMDDHFAAGWRRTHRVMHGQGLIEWAYRQNIPAGDIHVRANVLELTRGYFLKFPPNRPDEFDAARLSRLFRTATADRFVREYEEFMAVTGFSAEAKQDLHYTDLYHWEQRLGRWHSEVVRRSKVSHNTFIAWNARRVLTLMLARPDEDRWKARVIHRLIDRQWPEALETSIYSGASYVSPPPELPVGPPAFAWTRLAPEVRLAFADALGLEVAEGDADAAARGLAERIPTPTADDFIDERLVEVALADWLSTDPAALEQVYGGRFRDRPPASAAERVRRIGAQRDRPAGEPLRRALAAALLDAGGRLPAIADRAALRPYLRVPTTRLNPRPLAAHEAALLATLRARGDEPAGDFVELAPDAGGRRVLARWLLEDAVRAGRKVLWITQRVELLEQAALAFVEGAALLRERAEPLVLRLTGGAYGPHELGSLAAEGPDVTVASVAALRRNPAALDGLLREHEVVAVFEEAERAGAPAYQAVSDQVRAGARTVVGLVPAGAEALRDLVEAGALAAPQVERVQTGVAVDGSLPPGALGGLASGGLTAQVEAGLTIEARDATIVETWLAGRRSVGYGATVAFAVDAAHARALTERFQAAGVRAEWTSPLRPNRLALLERFRSIAYDVLVTAGPVPEGIDLPLVDTVLLCRPTRSRGLLAELCAVAMRGPAADGTATANLVTFRDRWEHLTGWLEPDDVLAGDGDADAPLVAELRRGGQRRRAFEALPQAVYDFEVDVALVDGETETRRHTILVTEHQLAGFDAFAAAAEQPDDLPPAYRLRARFFADVAPPLPPTQDLALLAAYARQRGVLPLRRALPGLESVAAGPLAERIVAGDLRMSEARQVIEDARASAPALVEALFGGGDAFAAEVLVRAFRAGGERPLG